MTSGLFLVGEYEGRAYIQCDGCGTHHTIHAYGINKTRTHAEIRGWHVAGYHGSRTDWCPTCEKPAVLFELEMP